MALRYYFYNENRKIIAEPSKLTLISRCWVLTEIHTVGLHEKKYNNKMEIRGKVKISHAHLTIKP